MKNKSIKSDIKNSRKWEIHSYYISRSDTRKFEESTIGMRDLVGRFCYVYYMGRLYDSQDVYFRSYYRVTRSVMSTILIITPKAIYSGYVRLDINGGCLDFDTDPMDRYSWFFYPFESGPAFISYWTAMIQKKDHALLG